MTVGGIPSPKIVPPTITTTDCSSEPKQPQSLDNSMVSSPTSSKSKFVTQFLGDFKNCTEVLLFENWCENSHLGGTFSHQSHALVLELS